MRPLAGFGLISVSLFMLLGFFRADLSGSGLENLVALLVTVGIPGTAGAVLLTQHFRRSSQLSSGKEQLKLQTQQSELLRLAGDLGGRLTVVEVVQHLAMTHVEADTLLKSMVAMDVADIEIADSGLLVYNFPDIQQLGDKSSSKGVLDA